MDTDDYEHVNEEFQIIYKMENIKNKTCYL